MIKYGARNELKASREIVTGFEAALAAAQTAKDAAQTAFNTANTAWEASMAAQKEEQRNQIYDRFNIAQENV